ncbi:MAG: beta-phosphoglucomutase [Alistipes sp.]
MIKCCIFDLDGVIVDTAKYHYQAWAHLAHELGFEFTPEQGEATKGVSRMASLEIVLAAGGMQHRFSAEQKEQMAAEKNARYLSYITRMTADELLDGVLCFLKELRAREIRVVLGSASKNAGVILDRCGIRNLFDQVVDGTLVSKAKPDPEVFAKGAELAQIDPAYCVVFEDAAAGVEAATRAGMRSVGVGGSAALCKATMELRSFEGFTLDRLIQTIDK